MAKIHINTDDLVSVAEAAVLLNIGIATAWRWVAKGKLKKTELYGRTLVSRKDIAILNKESSP
jgi:excisionase family DNA binding protein